MDVKMPIKSTPAQGCYYQVDLDYGYYLSSPVLAYGHGTLDCSEAPKPAATCEALTVASLNEEKTQYRFTTTATAINGATISGYRYVVSRDTTQVFTKTTASTSKTDTLDYSQVTPGTYKVMVYVMTSVGEKSCSAQFTVPTPTQHHPAVDVTKTVNNVEHATVKVGEAYNYQITVRNTGDIALTNVVVTDTPADATIQLVSGNGVGTIAGNVWTHTIASLAVNESKTFTLTAKVLAYKAGNLVNNVCVDAKEVVGTKDDCDDAVVDVPTPSKPAVDVQKTVNNVERVTVKVGEAYNYQITVRNTGNIALTNVVATDTPADATIQLVSGNGVGTIAANTWTYTIPTLALNESKTFTLTAKVLAYKAGALVNNVCVDAMEVPGTKDDCDTATVDVPTPGKIQVCDPDTGEIIEVNQNDTDGYLPTKDKACADMKVCDTDTSNVVHIKGADYDDDRYTTDLRECTDTPEVTELPATGAANIVVKLAGATSLAGAGAYYLASRRNRA
jgi:uncharacterized repeat protein (TIGR01451 family)/LPXTG-motif cell wall-anchored protein